MDFLKEADLFEEETHSGANPSIIVAEDEEILREVLLNQLTEKGYNVRGAADGAEAWELFQGQACEILLTDLDMPRMSGQQLIEKVREHSPATVVIVLTGHGSFDSARNLINLGCNEYLLKPLKDFNELDLVLKRSLERSILYTQTIIFKRLNMAKSRFLHELTHDLVAPTYTLLTTIDTLISLIKEGNFVKALPIAEGIKKKFSSLTMVVGRLAESSNRLKTMEG